MEQVFKALGDKTRLDIFLIINQVPEMCLCDLETLFSVSGSSLSRHLKELYQVNLLEMNKIGKWKYYRISSLGNQFVKLVTAQADKNYLQSIKESVTKIERSNRC